jgi:hypothetical protein
MSSMCWWRFRWLVLPGGRLLRPSIMVVVCSGKRFPPVVSFLRTLVVLSVYEDGRGDLVEEVVSVGVIYFGDPDAAPGLGG